MDERNKILLAIDPGDVQSAFVFVDMDTYKPLYFAKENNEDCMEHMINYICANFTIVDFCEGSQGNVTNCAIEMLASYGMSVGKTILFTATWVGRFHERLSGYIDHIDYIYRKDEKLCICGQMKAKDSNIRQALIDRFAKFDFKNGRGTKANPDWFYGFKADVWAAYAVAVCWLDAQRGLYTLTQE